MNEWLNWTDVYDCATAQILKPWSKMALLFSFLVLYWFFFFSSWFLSQQLLKMFHKDMTLLQYRHIFNHYIVHLKGFPRQRIHQQEMQERQVWPLGQEDPSESEMATCSRLQRNISLGNSMDRGTWLATVQEVAKSQRWLSNWACTHVHLKLIQFMLIIILICYMYLNKTVKNMTSKGMYILKLNYLRAVFCMYLTDVTMFPLKIKISFGTLINFLWLPWVAMEFEKGSI